MLSYIEISKENLLHNFQALKSLVKPEVKMVSVIKANAYGHGQNEVAKALEDVTDYFQVDDLLELKLLREVSKKPTLVLGYVSHGEMQEALLLDGILAVYDENQILELEKNAKLSGKKATVHVKIDAALGRQGMLISDIEKNIALLKKCENIQVDGIYSHFANIEDTTDFSHAQKQIDMFRQAVEMFRKNGYENLKTHISASSGIMTWENGQGDSSMVRAGIGLYGMWPSEDLRKKFNQSDGGNDFELRPVMRWVSHVAQVKILPANHSIGYGLTYVTTEPTKVAVIPQGYSDGVDRGLSNVGEVLIKGSRCKILGRVAMNMFVVDVSNLDDVAAEEEVVILGKQGGGEISAEEVAEKLDTINYEITTRTLALLPRVVV